jgi:nitrous oxidase accessory protein
MVRHTLSLLAILILASGLAARTHTVRPGPGAVAKVFAALSPGDTVLITTGTYFETDLRVLVPCVILGQEQAVIDARHQGASIMMIEADSVTIRGLTIKNVKVSYVDDNAAIKVKVCKGITVDKCTILEGMFGVYLSKAEDCRVTNNTLISSANSEANSGNGVHCWTSRNVLISGNRISGHRDGVYLEFMRHGTVLNNYCERNLRYGLHFMFSDSCSYRKNTFTRNGAGVAVMYTKYVQMTDNTFLHNWGPSTYGLLLKDITDSHIKGNRFEQNSIAVYTEGANRILFEDNAFVKNGYAMRMLGNCDLNTVRNNTFSGNTFDVTTNSRESSNQFSKNFWSDYDGYDLNKDGFGDVPYHPVRLYSYLIEQMPSSVILMHSAFVDILDMTERIIPTVTPELLVDRSPRMKPLHQ